MEQTSTGLSTSLRQSYTKEECDFILIELKRLGASRQETYSKVTLHEWISSFFEKGLPASTVCKMIAAVRMNTKVFGKLSFSDFINADISGIKNTTSLYNDPTAHFLIVLTCSNCGRTTTVKKLDAFDFPRNIKCAKCSRILTPDKLNEFAQQISENFEEFKY
jgi:ribosomal protein S27E